MKNRQSRIIVLCILVITVLTAAAVVLFGKNYTIYLNNPYHSEKIAVEFSDAGIVENTDIRFKDGYIELVFRSVKKGKVSVTSTVFNEADEKEYTCIYSDITVLPTGVIYVAGYDYGGWQFVVFGLTLLMLFSFAVCLTRFGKRKKTQFFSYKTVLDLALSFFFGLQSVLYLGLSLGCIVYPQVFEGWKVYNLVGFIMMALFFASVPLLVVFAAFMSLSNLALIRHEGFGKNNLFGILISIALLIGSVVCVITALRNPNSTGITPTEIRDSVIRTIASSSFVYFECILLSTQICTQYIARHKPAYDKDFIVILGCKIRKDGTPLPLLRGRIDKALAFYKEQLEEAGKQAQFIPSGGQGRNEIISEAESMKRYLTEQGIDESIIHPENASTNTLENMRFSKRIADEQTENANILFATTNYHVFRSGILSAKAGLNADGIGARTKWYFWPNAQIREFIGLLASEWKINVLIIVLTVVLSVLFANITTIINFLLA